MSADTKLADEERRQVLRDLLIVRRFEEKCLEVYEDEGIPELPHLSIGQEAVGVGGLFALREDDWVVPSLRTRAAMLLRAPLKEITAGLWGTVSGPTQGRTTQHHMGSTEYHILGTTGMIGSHLNPAGGTALSSKILGDDRVTLVFFGDGAVQRGEFHSALNFSAVNDLPVIFMIENNGWTEETPVEEVTPVEDLAELAPHMPSTTIDGQDVELVIEEMSDAIERARTGDGPSLIEAKTYRFRPHAEVIPERRPKKEVEEWKQRDPVDMHQSRLLNDADVTKEDIDAMDEEICEEINEAFDLVETDPLPDEEVMYHVYKDVDIDHENGTVIR